ncbi:MAG: HAD family phosphatase [Clostridia bacterium]|nr:HAD family phosphatase [Clostridia bacterium]
MDSIKPSLVIFDMDGLMFDTERLAITFWKMAARDFGFHIEESMVIEAIGMDARDTEKVFQKYLGTSFPYREIRERRLQYTDDHIEKKGIPVKKGLYSLIQFLELQSVKKAVATSTFKERALKLLSLANIKDSFDLILCGDEVSKGKPEPDIFLTAARRLNRSPEECIVLEDSENGILAAYRAGMVPFWVPDIKIPKKEIQSLASNQFDSLTKVTAYLKNIFSK